MFFFPLLLSQGIQLWKKLKMRKESDFNLRYRDITGMGPRHFSPLPRMRHNRTPSPIIPKPFTKIVQIYMFVTVLKLLKLFP